MAQKNPFTKNQKGVTPSSSARRAQQRPLSVDIVMLISETAESSEEFPTSSLLSSAAM